MVNVLDIRVFKGLKWVLVFVLGFIRLMVS